MPQRSGDDLAGHRRAGPPLLPVRIAVVAIPLGRNAIAVPIAGETIVIAVKLIGNAVAIAVAPGAPPIVMPIVMPIIGIRDAVAIPITHRPASRRRGVSDLDIDLGLGGRNASKGCAEGGNCGSHEYWSAHRSISPRFYEGKKRTLAKQRLSAVGGATRRAGSA
jgi:hypothetical protein